MAGSRRTLHSPNARIQLLVIKNPKREGSASRARFNLYKDGMNVRDALVAGITRGDLRWDEEHKFIRIGAPTDAAIDDLEEDYREEGDDAFERTFHLERDMQSALRDNLDHLEAGLEAIDGGSEQNTEAGRIDITAQDQDGNVVVIELKAGTADRNAIGQILSYMGAIAESPERPVRGILVASDFDQRARYAAKPISNLSLRRYRVQFQFEEA